MTSRSYDVVALGGVISAALLRKRGGCFGGTEFEGYWIDWGHRDGHAYGELAVIFHRAAQAAHEVGSDIEFKPWSNGRWWRTHRLPEGTMSEMASAEALGELTADPIVGYRKLAAFLGMRSNDEIDTLVKEAMQKLTSIPDQQAWQAVEQTMGDWLAQNVPHPEPCNMVLQMLENACASPAEHAALGRFVFQSRGDVGYSTAKIGVPDDPRPRSEY